MMFSRNLNVALKKRLTQKNTYRFKQILANHHVREMSSQRDLLRRPEKDVGEADVESADRQIKHQMIPRIPHQYIRTSYLLVATVFEGCMMENMYNCRHVLTVL